MSGTMTLSRRSFMVMTTAALAACKAQAGTLNFSGQTMGTQYHVTALPAQQSVDKQAVAQAIKAALTEVDQQMSNWNQGSEISRINAAGTDETMTLSPAMARVLTGASDVHRASEGRFDVTVGPLIDLWGFGADGTNPHLPSDADIAAALGRTGQSRAFSLQGTSLRKTAPGAEIYLSAIGKGYGVDRVADALRSFGLTDFMVEIGGDLYTSGRNAAGQPWQIGIENPIPGERSVYSVVDVSNLGMATSGDYRNFFNRMAPAIRISSTRRPGGRSCMIRSRPRF